MAKKKLIDDLREYFTSKGKFLSYQEYIVEEDTPFRAQIVKRYIGTWARLENIIGPIEPKPEPKPVTKVETKPEVTKVVASKGVK